MANRNQLRIGVRQMAEGMISAYFPNANGMQDFNCNHCSDFISAKCPGRGLDYRGVIGCLVDMLVKIG